jgi:hypothetical protein
MALSPRAKISVPPGSPTIAFKLGNAPNVGTPGETSVDE